jgi:hypothetical protein
MAAHPLTQLKSADLRACHRKRSVNMQHWDTSQVRFNRLESVPAGGLNEKNWKRGGNRWATPIAGQETDKARLADRTKRCLVMQSLLVHPRPNVEPSSPGIRLKFLDIVTAHSRFIITHGLSGIPKCPK